VFFFRIKVFIAKSLIEGFDTGSSSLFGTGLIADGKSGHCTMYLDLEVVPVMFVKQT
jgi:hypothetical protein